MPNWCFTKHALLGPNDELKAFADKIEEWTSKNYTDNGFGKNWLGNIVLGAGLETVETISDGIPCRGKFCGDWYFEDGQLWFDTETAWGPMPEMWEKLVEMLAPHCTYHWLATESGCGVFFKDDPDNLCFAGSDYFVDEYHENENEPIIVCGEDDDDLVSEEFLEKKLREYYDDSTSSLQELIARAEDEEFNDPNSFISIIKIESEVA